MTGPALTVPMIALTLFCVCAESAMQLSLKAASAAGTFAGLLRAPPFYLACGLWLLEVAAWVYVLEFVPMSIAFPLMSLVYVGTALGARLVLGERMSRRQVLGALLITAGAACVGACGI